jgi:hypothetical protein
MAKKYTPNTKFPPDAVEAIISKDYFECRPNSRGNVQILLKDMGKINDYEKCRRLVEMTDQLYAAGIIADPKTLSFSECPVSLSWNTGEKDKDGNDIYRPYPKAWANQPSTQTVQASAASEQAMQANNRVDRLEAMMEKMLAAQAGNPSPVVIDVTPQSPDDSDIPFAD